MAGWAGPRIAHCCLITQKWGELACVREEPWCQEDYMEIIIIFFLLRELASVEHLLCDKHGVYTLI